MSSVSVIELHPVALTFTLPKVADVPEVARQPILNNTNHVLLGLETEIV